MEKKMLCLRYDFTGLKTGIFRLLLFALLPFMAVSCDYFFPPFSGERIPVEEAYKYIMKNEGSPELVIIDVRKAASYSLSHIPGAVNYDYDSTGFPGWIEKLDKSKVYIVYSEDESKSFNTIELMLELRFRSPHAIKGGFIQWKENGFPVIK